MPRILFYAGTACCLLLALCSASEMSRELQGGTMTFGALAPQLVHSAPASIIVALLAGAAVTTILLRMISLLAVRNMFSACLALLSVSAAMASLTGLLALESRMMIVVRHGSPVSTGLGEMHFALFMSFGYFVSVAMLSLRPYFRIQASRLLAGLVFFPLPIFLLILVQEILGGAASGALPLASPASLVYYGIIAVIFFAIGVHCIRHRYLFLETTNLRDLFEAQFTPRPGLTHGPLGGIAFHS